MVGRLLTYAASVVLLVMSAPALSQEVAPAKAAPLPTQLSTARKVFVSNASGAEPDRDQHQYFIPGWSVDEPYNRFYAALSKTRFEPVLSPGEADLIFEIRFATPLPSAHIVDSPQLYLEIFDPKTHVLLWAFSRRADMSGGPHWKEKRSKNFDQSLEKLVDDVVKLASRPQ
jgi:hypothetical protein